MELLDSTDPARIGPYRLLGRLGAGGMGKVYLGRSAAGRTVAVKVVRPELAGDSGFRARFRAEVSAARAVSGAFTAPVVDADPDGELPWMATRFVVSLALGEAVARRGPLPERALRMLLGGISEALESIHAVGLVHRDLKPGNVLLALDGPHVVDFGIARAVDGTAFTTTGSVLGSPGYMSPEQALGRAVTPASDMFALGATLVFAASGIRPFGDDHPVAVLRRVVNDPVELGSVPASMRDAVEACLDKSPERRPTPRRLIDFVGDGPVDGGGSWLPAELTGDIMAADQVMQGTGVPQPLPPVGVVPPLHSAPTEVTPPYLPPEPDFAPPPIAPPGAPSRRKLIIGLSAAAAVAVAGGGAAIAMSRSGKGGSAAKGGSPSPTAKTTGVPTGQSAAPAAPPAPHGPLPAPTGKKGSLDGPAAVPKWTSTTPDTVVSLSSYGGMAIAAGFGGRHAFDPTGNSRWNLPIITRYQGGTDGSAGNDKSVYFVGGDTIRGGYAVIAADPVTGAEQWRAGIPRTTWAPTRVAGVVGGMLLVAGDDIGNPAQFLAKFVWALDIGSRQTVWEASGPDVGSLFIPPAGTRILMSAEQLTQRSLQLVDAGNKGARGWTKPVHGAVGGAYVKSPACWAAGRFVYATDKVYALDLDTGEEAWTYPVAGESFTNCVSDTDGSTVFAGSTKALYCLDGKSGDLRWKSTMPKETSAMFAEIRYDFGNVYLMDSAGTLWAVDAATGTTRWKYRDARQNGTMLGMVPWAAGGGMVYVGDASTVTGIDAAGT
ncbi:PQQ-binding-like beta-propeller repeat protein [Embleya sp. NPDC005575]|uniref:protein kinase domain-containing protein n=1 Tax=Embleya sp. NPDC005575 TaxID=3156892 RepID=UPI0033A6034A